MHAVARRRSRQRANELVVDLSADFAVLALAGAKSLMTFVSAMPASRNQTNGRCPNRVRHRVCI